MSPEQTAALQQERRHNLGTITGLETRIRLSQEEIDALTKRNVKIDAELAGAAKQKTESSKPK